MRIYDMATLTGAAIHALGHLHSAVIGTDQKAIDQVRVLSAELGEPCWQLPINEAYRDLTRGSYADLQNLYAPGQGADPKASNAWCFQVLHFVHMVLRELRKLLRRDTISCRTSGCRAVRAFMLSNITRTR